MAGGVAKTFGIVLTVAGALMLATGVGTATYGASVLVQESGKMLPDEDRARDGASGLEAGTYTALAGLGTLFLGIPTLVWGTQRVRDGETGRLRTRKGGALKAWGLTFILLGCVVALLGILAAGLAASVADEESRAFIARHDRLDFAVTTGETAIYVVAGGSLAVLAGVPLLVIGGWRRRTLEAAGTKLPHEARGPAAIVTSLVVCGLLALIIVYAVGGQPVGLDAFAGEFTAADATYEGRVMGAGAPVAGSVGAGQQEAVHTLDNSIGQGIVSASVTWSSTEPGSAATLRVVLETVGADGAWHAVATGDGSSTLEVSSPHTRLGNQVRARVSVAPGQAGAADYTLRLSTQT